MNIYILHQFNIISDTICKKPVEIVSSGGSVHAEKLHDKKILIHIQVVCWLRLNLS